MIAEFLALEALRRTAPLCDSLYRRWLDLGLQLGAISVQEAAR